MGSLHARNILAFFKQSMLAVKSIMSLLFAQRQCHAITQINLFANGAAAPPPTPPLLSLVHAHRKKKHVIITFAAREGFVDHVVFEWGGCMPLKAAKASCHCYVCGEKGFCGSFCLQMGGGGCTLPNPPPPLFFNSSCAPQRTACHHYVCSKALFGGSCVLKTGGLHAPQRSCFTKQSVLAAKGIMSLLFLLRQCHAITQIILFAHGCGCDPPTPPASFTSSCTPQRTARHHYVCSKGRICGS